MTDLSVVDKPTSVSSLAVSFGALIAAHQSDLVIDSWPSVQTMRQAAIEAFVATGLPTIKHEEWKYTAPKAFAALDVASFMPRTSPSQPALPTADYQAPTLVLQDGQITTLPTDSLGKGITVTSFADLSKDQIDTVKAHLGSLAPLNDAFVALNTAAFTDGLLLEATKGAVSDHQLHIIHQYTGSKQVAYTRILIVVGEHAELKLAHHIVGNANAEIAFGVLVSEAIVAKDAILKVDIVEEAAYTHLVAGWYCTQADATVTSHTTITLDGPWVRNNLQLMIPGQHAEGNMYGLYLGSDRNLIDNHTLVDHIAPNSHSNELYKGVAKDRSIAVFNGKIFVKQAAQKTNAFQSNRNLILSDDATVNTKPQLEIFADDVKCSHGATTGALDEEPIFYLRSRGLDEDQARSLLLQAFADEVNNYLVSDSLRSIATEAVERFLH